MKQHSALISKVDQARQIVYAEVYIPMVPDSHGDFMQADEIEKAAHDFLKSGKINAVDTEHDLQKNGSAVIESFIAREGDPDFIKGAWVVGIHITDDVIWDQVIKQELNGFSMYGQGIRTEKVLEIEIPDDGIIKGDTGTAGIVDHTHQYKIQYSKTGEFLGGETTPHPTDGHVHTITQGTITNPAGGDDHVHKFSFLEAFNDS